MAGKRGRNKQRGSSAERELFHQFWGEGWTCLRTAGSGSVQYAAPDLTAGKEGRLFVIECKAGASIYKYLDKYEVEELQQFAQAFGAEAWIAVRYNHAGWYFLRPEQLRDTGGRYAVTQEEAEKNGVRFEKLIGKNTEKPPQST
ncbi:MAG: Holliday junction resolvase Hjc [Nanoarchaeota archaeon]|nr:Holliday junction resolvase Hjc [Nanoarchaeota archaeon]